MRDFTPLPIREVVVEDAPLDLPAVPQRNFINFNIDPDLGTMQMDNLQSRYFSIGNTCMNFYHDVLLVPPASRHTHYGLAIMNSYKGTVQFDGGKWIDVNHGESYLTFNPGVDEYHRFFANLPMKVNFLTIEPTYLTKILLEQEADKGSELYNFRENVVSNKFAGAGTKMSSPSVSHLISAMFSCPLQGTLGNLMLEGTLQQLLAVQFSLLGSEAPKKQTIGRRDREVMHALKAHLDATFNEDHTLLDLSKKFGINQNKLKTQFRELFGVPVIGYLFDLKMEHARTLLMDKGLFVGEVSSLVGYRNANHFATAFKRKFGINPSTLKS